MVGREVSALRASEKWLGGDRKPGPHGPGYFLSPLRGWIPESPRNDIQSLLSVDLTDYNTVDRGHVLYRSFGAAAPFSGT